MTSHYPKGVGACPHLEDLLNKLRKLLLLTTDGMRSLEVPTSKLSVSVTVRSVYQVTRHLAHLHLRYV